MNQHKLELVMETLADIAIMAGRLLAKEQIVVLDSRELVSTMCEWATEFEDWFETRRDDDDTEYLDAIDEFSERRLLSKYGAKGGEADVVE